MRGSFWIRLGIVLGVPLLFYLAATGSFLLAYPFALASVLLILGFCLFLQFSHLRRTIVIIFTCCFFCYSLFGWGVQKNTVHMAFVPSRITRVDGILCEDSLLCESGKQLLRLNLTSCATQDGASGSAKGVLSALVKVDETLVSGSRVSMTGELAPEGSLFLASGLQVLSLSRIRAFRRKLLIQIELRFTQVMGNEQSRSLALMLLLGRTGDAAFPLKAMSLGSGCAHLLALSGMHLQFLIGLFSFVLAPLVGKRRGRVISVLLALLYVLLVGPKPSLVRAMGMAILSLFLKGRLSSYYSFLAIACIQTLLFPSALSSMGGLFSYAAYGGLLCNSLFSFYRPKLLDPFFASVYAILFTAIPTLLIWPTWQVGGLFVAPIASFLIFSLMGTSLLVGIFGTCFAFSVDFLYRMLSSVFSFGNNLFGGGVAKIWLGPYLLVVLTLLATIGYAERALQTRRRNSYELEIRIRFTEGNNELAR